MNLIFLCLLYGGCASAPKPTDVPPCSTLEQNRFMVETAGVHDESVLQYMQQNFEATYACSLGDES